MTKSERKAAFELGQKELYKTTEHLCGEIKDIKGEIKCIKTNDLPHLNKKLDTTLFFVKLGFSLLGILITAFSIAIIVAS